MRRIWKENEIMKKLSAPAMPEELTEETFNQEFTEGAAALFFCDETRDRELTGSRFDECSFRNITFHHEMSRTLFADCIFDHCDFSNCDFNESVFRRCVFRSCRMTGTDFSWSRFNDAELTGCEASYANFSCSKFKVCRFSEVRCNESSFLSCTFDNMQIEQCGFVSAEFNDTKLKGLDFSDSDISDITVGLNELKGVTLNEEQALACARLLGIIVKR